MPTPLTKLVPLAKTLMFVASYLMASNLSYAGDWFEKFKQQSSDQDLYRLLYAMPKGGDIHNHMSGSGFGDWWYDLGIAQKSRGYEYFTKVKINNCRDYGENQFGYTPYYLMFRNISKQQHAALSECEQNEFKALATLTETEKQGWINSLRLDKAHEGRDEFFQTHWQRLGALLVNPYLIAEILVKNMQAFSEEGLIYLETMLGARGFRTPNGQLIPVDTVVALYKNRLNQADALATKVTVRLQTSILRFAPNAEQQLIDAYKLVARYPDLYVGVNMVGREDNDKGHPLRFKETLRKLRKTYHGVKLAIHAGEVDEPNHHIRDTLLIGADRIGHGLNLITDDDLLSQMRHGPYLVEINLISNLLLEYVNTYQEHPFPEYLRLGVPVTLSTDDRGMWDSNLTDEYFVAVKEFNLSWQELKILSQNGIRYSFLDPATKNTLAERVSRELNAFEQHYSAQSPKEISKQLQNSPARSHQFICNRYKLCTSP